MPRLASAAMVLVAVGVGGCDVRYGEEIRTYRVAKEEPPGPVDADLMNPGGAPTGVLEWDLPEGWSTNPNPNEMRFATLQGGDGAEAIDVAITVLGGAAGGLGANINRWRGQVGLPSASEEQLAQDVMPITARGARGARGIMVDLIGPAEPGGEGEAPRMLAAIFPAGPSTWFIKTIGTQAVLQQHRDAFLALCESVRFSGAPAASMPPSSAPPVAGRGGGGALPTWEVLPAGWSVDADPKPMSLISFTVTDGGQEASFTITPLGGNQDLLANINRWRRQVGLGPIANLADTPPLSIDIDGTPGDLVDIVGPERHTLGVVWTGPSMTWFFKLTGPDPLVANQRSAFEAFVGSFDFSGRPNE